MSIRLILAVILFIYVQGLYAAPSPASIRITVVKNSVAATPTYLAFMSNYSDTSGKGLLMASSNNGDNWTQWSSPISTNISSVSNPIAISSYVTAAKKNLIFVFVQTTDGQLTALMQSATNPTQFSAKVVASNLPTTLKPSQFSQDPVQAITLKNRTFVFIRTQSSTSQLFWNVFKDSLAFESTDWKLVGDKNTHLTFDPCVAINTFLGRLEVFSVFNTQYVHHTWQDGESSFHNEWLKLGGPFAPKFGSSPVVHQMAHSVFNGVLNLFARGEDGQMYHISQTTCDTVNNVWGPCTWTVFSKLGGLPPSDKSLPNPFIATHSIHLGIEIITVGKADGHLYHIWQSERGDSYSDWEDMGPLTDSSPFMSSPALLFNSFGWWEGFALNSSHSVARFMEKPLKFALSTDTTTFGKNVTVTWAIPKNQATHMDWIGVYPKGAPSHDYVDFSYVGGTQNPYKDPVPQGSLQFRSFLPNGTYDYRYMVNKHYDAALEATVTVTGAPHKMDWVSVFDGLSLGLGGFNTNISKCESDGEQTVDKFKASFTAFEDRKIIEGLNLFGQALEDFKVTLVQCNETEIVKLLDGFIQDLVSCTENACVKFLIDMGEELLILYEHIYEIYGDIQGAINSFKMGAYEQGGICIGRVTNACLTLE